MRRKSNLNNEWNRHFVLGYTDEETVMLDFDSTSFKTVKYWALRALKWFKLEGFIILKSSLNNYHVVFNRTVSWKQNMKIVAWVALQCHNRLVEKWFLMQCIKEGSTLRISPKLDKPSPRIVFRYGKENGQIESFLRFRGLMKNIIRKLKGD
ncbi:MAG: hypothetical protein JSV12_03485 [Candidatus Bathyarchaeota archaeon]|nr:MAG: hypothetical protein JSV12_03485 [Candidatus Bathyarchaeota archaeon]